jgi:predicted histone-like DNA-binding protein
MIYYKLKKNNNQKSTQYGKWYARAKYLDTVDLDGLAAHMASHNSVFTEGNIKGLLTDMVNCIKELVLDGKAVKIDDLAIFSVGMQTTPADSAEEFTVTDNVAGFRLNARATGKLSTQNIKLSAKLQEYSQYNVPKQTGGE